MLREGRLDSGSFTYSKPSGEGKIHIICLVACTTYCNLVNIVLSAGSI